MVRSSCWISSTRLTKSRSQIYDAFNHSIDGILADASSVANDTTIRCGGHICRHAFKMVRSRPVARNLRLWPDDYRVDWLLHIAAACAQHHESDRSMLLCCHAHLHRSVSYESIWVCLDIREPCRRYQACDGHRSQHLSREQRWHRWFGKIEIISQHISRH